MPQTYLALGDSMSIDAYTGVAGGGAVKQLWRRLPGEWKLADETFDGCTMAGVPTHLQGDLITLTIGGNDLLLNREHYLAGGMPDFGAEHLALLEAIRARNPRAIFVVGNIYAPQTPLGEMDRAGLSAANAMIEQNVLQVGGILADIHATFHGHEQEYLCFEIEPNLRGAEVIAGLMFAAFAAAG